MSGYPSQIRAGVLYPANAASRKATAISAALHDHDRSVPEPEALYFRFLIPGEEKPHEETEPVPAPPTWK
jgi:hypothetical protein